MPEALPDSRIVQRQLLPEVSTLHWTEMVGAMDGGTVKGLAGENKVGVVPSAARRFSAKR